MWLSLVEYLNGVQVVVGSNPAIPTKRGIGVSRFPFFVSVNLKESRAFSRRSTAEGIPNEVLPFNTSVFRCIGLSLYAIPTPIGHPSNALPCAIRQKNILPGLRLVFDKAFGPANPAR